MFIPPNDLMHLPHPCDWVIVEKCRQLFEVMKNKHSSLHPRREIDNSCDTGALVGCSVRSQQPMESIMVANPSLEDIIKNAKISEPTPLENSVREVISGTLKEVTITMETFSINRIQKSASVTFIVNRQSKGLFTTASQLALDLVLRVRAENIILGMGIHDSLTYDIEIIVK